MGLTAAALYVGCPFRLGVVRGDSMSPTVKNGAFYLMDRAYYRTHPVRPGEIIVFRLGNEVLTKRVYAAPGNTVSLLRFAQDGTYEVPRPVDMGRLNKVDAWARRRHLRAAVRLVRLQLPEDRCFVLGDNSAGSYDSRQFGPLDTATILGKVVAFTPPDRPQQLASALAPW
jgi:signal peptidase I